MTDLSAFYVHIWSTRPALRVARWTMRKGRRDPRRERRGITGGVVEMGTGERPAAGDTHRGQWGKGRKLVGCTDIRQADIEEMPGQRKQPEKTY